MRPRAAGLAVLLFICFAALFCTGAAAETGSVLSIADAPETVRRGSAFRIELAPAHQDLSAFVLFAEYDSADIERAEAEFSGAFDADYTYVSAQEGRIAVVYTAENGRTAPQDGRIVFTFKTKSDALSDTLPVRFTVTDAASGDAQPLLGAPQTLDAEPAFQPAPSSDSALLSLLPPEGKLSPAFDPDIFDYTLEVPYSSTSLVFDAVPAEGASVRVNRKNLGAGGSTVDFEFTVTAADGETKSVYTVAVTRLQKGASAGSSDSGSGSTGSGRSSAETTGNGGESETEAAAASAAPSGTAVQTVQADVQTAVGDSGGLASASSASYDTLRDRLLTVGLTLLSVGFGAALAVLLLRFLPARGKHRSGEDAEKRD